MNEERESHISVISTYFPINKNFFSLLVDFITNKKFIQLFLNVKCELRINLFISEVNKVVPIPKKKIHELIKNVFEIISIMLMPYQNSRLISWRSFGIFSFPK